MSIWLTYGIIAAVLFAAELIYFIIADQCNIIDKPNERSSHSAIVLRGGGVIFTVAAMAWALWMQLSGHDIGGYWPFLIGLMLVAGVSFWDDVRSLPDGVRLAVHCVDMLLMFWSIGIMQWDSWWLVLIALVVCVGATNVINFMDGINGITAGYSLSVLLPLLLLNRKESFIEESFLWVVVIGVLVFCFFNFRPKGKAMCFAGDVGSIGIAFIMLFAIGRLVVQTNDCTYLIMLLVYGVDGCLTIVHRIMLHERLGEAHRKHAYQLMANELHIGHVQVSLLYMGLQLLVSLGFIYLCPDSFAAHWAYLIGAVLLLSSAYVVFMKRYYHLHEEYLNSLASHKR